MQQVTTQPRIKIYPRSVKGIFRNIKTGILVFAYGVYFLLPWWRWERNDGPNQAVLFDIVGRKFYIFDLVVYAQDIFWLAGILIIASLLLFFITGIFGRVFCGYFCFQTLWTDVFMFIERHVQGERPARVRLAAAPWSASKVIKFSTTYILWLLVAFMTGLAFVLYWGNAPEMLQAVFTFTAPFATNMTIVFLTLTTFVMAGIAREQVCTYMCPYARFQSVMFDRDTAIVAFDFKRGEREQGRQKISKKTSAQETRIEQGIGDCVDCGYCVQVCPTGIDIRNGMQYHCITCALCIDACNNIMDALKYPRGLIRYTSDAELEGGKTHWLKPKSIAYALTISAATLLLIISIISRQAFEISVEQIRQPLYVLLSDGSIQNRYEIKLNNKTDDIQYVSLLLRGIKGATLDMGHQESIELKAGQRIKLPIKVTVSDFQPTQRNVPIEFLVTIDGEIKQYKHKSHFSFPAKSVVDK